MASSPAAAPPFTRTLQRYFEVALYLLVLTGFGALASTGGLDLPAVALVGSALLWRGYLIARKRTQSLPERWTSVLTLGYMVFYIADLFVISGQFLAATVHLVLFVMVVRLYSARRDRDYYFLAVISFLMVLAAAVLTVGSVFLGAFALFMLVAVATFILMEMRNAAGKSKVHSKGLDDEATVAPDGPGPGGSVTGDGAVHSVGRGRDLLRASARFGGIPQRLLAAQRVVDGVQRPRAVGRHRADPAIARGGNAHPD